MGRDEEISLLSTVNGRTLSLSELRDRLKRRTESVQACVQSLVDLGFLQVNKERKGRGRPRSMVTATPLGTCYLDGIKELDRLRLRLRDINIRKTVRQTMREMELIEMGRSPYDTFWNITVLAWTLEHAQEDTRNIQG